jgi:hypothetical protein
MALKMRNQALSLLSLPNLSAGLHRRLRPTCFSWVVFLD